MKTTQGRMKLFEPTGDHFGVTLSVRLDEVTFNRLTELSEAWRESESEVVASLIEWAWDSRNRLKFTGLRYVPEGAE